MRIRAMPLLVAAVLLAMAPFAQADPLLTLTLIAGDGASTTVQDNGPGDLSSEVGAVNFNGAVGNWSVNVTTGISKPIMIGMDLNSVNVSPSAPDTLTILLSDDFFSQVTPGFAMGIGGTNFVGGPLTYKAFLDTGNSLFTTPPVVGGTVSQIGALGPFGQNAFSGSGDYHHPAGPTAYSLTQQIDITATKSGIVSFDASLDPVPEPTTLLLVGLALIGGAALGRRRFFPHT